MLTHLRMQGFKAWRDTGDVRLAPLTVLFGANSAGKTSIPQLLLMLKQTVESADRQRVLHFGDSRTMVELGTFDDLLHGHDTRTALEFELGWSPDGSMEINSFPLGELLEHAPPRRGEGLRFHTTIRADKNHQPYVDTMDYLLGELDKDGVRIGMQRRRDGKYDLNAENYNPVRNPGRAWPLPAPQRFFGFPPEAVAYYQNTSFVSDLSLSLDQLLRRVLYVGPLREYPRRLYLWSGELPQDVGARGDRAIEAILAARDRKFNWKAKQRKRTLEELVASRLKQMGLIHDFRVKRLGQHRNEYEVHVRTSESQPEVRLTDVGFGVSQVLPVIVECFYVPARSIVIFEQPEIHLHPGVQADLADVFIDAVNAREDGTPRNVQFIVESHSEHFLRRLQRRIAEGALKPEQAALYFVRRQGGAARLEALDVDPFGNIRNWPDGFFGDEMEDLVARAEAQATRMASGEVSDG